MRLNIELEEAEGRNAPSTAPPLALLSIQHIADHPQASKHIYSKPHLNVRGGRARRDASVSVKVCRRSLFPTGVIGEMPPCSCLSGLKAVCLCGTHTQHTLNQTPCMIHMKKEMNSHQLQISPLAPFLLDRLMGH